MADDAQDGTQQQDDTDAEDMLADAVENDGGSQEDQGKQLDPDAKAKINKANREAAGLRKRLKELEPLAAKLQELEDAKKSDLEKANERVSGLESRATSAEQRALQLEVALDKAPEGMPVAKVRALAKRLSGSTQEELEADAEELFAQFAATTNGDGGDAKAGGRPKEKLRGVPLPGGDKVQLDEETDPRKLAERIKRI